MSQVNLLPPELLARQKQRRLTSTIIAGGAVVFVLLLGFWFLESQKLTDVNEQVAAQNATNAGLQAQIQGLAEYQALQEEAAGKEALLAEAYAGEVSFSGLLMDMSRVIPSDAYLTGMNVQLTETAPGTTTAAATTPTGLIGTITADGQAAGVESLASWLTRLESVQGWVNPWLNSIQETSGGSRLYTFTSGVDLSDQALTARGSQGSAGAG